MSIPDFVLATVACFVTACTTVKNKPDETLTEREVRAFIEQYDRAWNSKDSAAVNKSLSEGYLYFTSLGGSNDKRGTLLFLSDTAYVIHDAKRPEMKVTIHGNVAIVNTHWIGDLSWKGQTIHDNQRCGITVAKIKGSLQILSEHCVEIKQE